MSDSIPLPPEMPQEMPQAVAPVMPVTLEQPTTVITRKPLPDGSGIEERVRTEQRRSYPITGSSLAFSAPRSAQHGAAHEDLLGHRPPNDRYPFSGLSRDNLSAAKYFEACAQNKDCADWKISVQRIGPSRWPPGKKGKAIRIGDYGTMILDTFQAIKQRIIEAFGGGRYKLILYDESMTSKKEQLILDISTQDFAPRNPPVAGEDEEEEEDRASSPNPAQAEDKVAQYKKQEAEMLAKAQCDRTRRKLEQEEKAAEEGWGINMIHNELRENQRQIADLMSKTIETLAAKKDGGGDTLEKLAPLAITFLQTVREERKAEEERRERERKEENERRRLEEERRERERKEENERRRLEEERRMEAAERRRQEEREERRREEDRRDAMQKEQLQLLLKAVEKKEDNTTPLMLKTLQEGNQAFLTSLIESNKMTKSEIGETARTQSQLLERFIQVMTETTRNEGGKYEKLMDALIANRLEAGSREVENFVKAMEMGKSQLREAMQLAQGDEQDEATPTVDPQQGFWNNLSNVILALILSKAGGNKDIQQGVAHALGQTGAPALTMADYQQVAQGMTPLVAQRMGIQAPPMSVTPMMPPQVPTIPVDVPIPPTVNVPIPPIQGVSLPPPTQPVTLVPQPPVAQPPVAQAVEPQAPSAGPKPVPEPPKIDAETMLRLRERIDEMLENACNDLTDESREQGWTDYALDYLPKWFLDRMTMLTIQNRKDLAITLIRQAASVDKFTRLQSLVMDSTRYQIFMSGIMEIVNTHREERERDGYTFAQPAPVNGAPVPTGGPPASAVSVPPTAIPAPPTAVPAPPTAVPAPPTAVPVPPTAVPVPPTAPVDAAPIIVPPSPVV